MREYRLQALPCTSTYAKLFSERASMLPKLCACKFPFYCVRSFLGLTGDELSLTITHFGKSQRSVACSSTKGFLSAIASGEGAIQNGTIIVLELGVMCAHFSSFSCAISPLGAVGTVRQCQSGDSTSFPHI